MKGGHIQQIGDPKRIYDEPKNAFVADFIGESNITARHHDGGRSGRDLRAQNSSAWTRALATNEPVDVVVRPEDIMIVGEDVGMLTGVVESRDRSRACITR